MSKTELVEKSGICWSSLEKLKNGQNVNTDLLLKVCKALNCSLSDIVEIEDDENEQ